MAFNQRVGSVAAHSSHCVLLSAVIGPGKPSSTASSGCSNVTRPSPAPTACGGPPTPPPPPPTPSTLAYHCTQGQCVQQGGAGVLNLTECKAICEPLRYACNNETGQCALDTGGVYSKEVCQEECKPAEYVCVNGQCVRGTAGNLSRKECMSACS
jgi:hypothetical protein